MSEPSDKWKETQAKYERYRKAAKRLYPTASMRDFVSVNEDMTSSGAFIEMTVWIPREEADKETNE